MANSADPDQLASSEANIWIYTVCKGRVYQAQQEKNKSLSPVVG